MPHPRIITLSIMVSTLGNTMRSSVVRSCSPNLPGPRLNIRRLCRWTCMLLQNSKIWYEMLYTPKFSYLTSSRTNQMGFEVVAGYTEPVAHGSTSSPPTDHFDPHGTGWISEPPVVPTQEPHGCFPLSPEVPDPTKSPSDNYSQMLNSIQDQILSAEGIDRPSQSTLAFSDYDFASQPYSLYANSYPEAIETPMPNFYLPPSPLAGAFNPSSSSLANALIPLDAQEKSTPISHTNRVSQKAGSIRSPANGKGRQPSTSKLAKSSRSSGSSQRYDASEITQPSHNQASDRLPYPLIISVILVSG